MTGSGGLSAGSGDQRTAGRGDGSEWADGPDECSALFGGGCGDGWGDGEKSTGWFDPWKGWLGHIPEWGYGDGLA